MPAERSIHYLPAAEKDLLEILDFISLDSQARASRFIDHVDHAIGRLAHHPALGHEPRMEALKKKGYRILPVESYLVFYRIKASAIIVFRVLHGSRWYKGLL